jgi:hypothetical protein
MTLPRVMSTAADRGNGRPEWLVRLLGLGPNLLESEINWTSSTPVAACYSLDDTAGSRPAGNGLRSGA